MAWAYRRTADDAEPVEVQVTPLDGSEEMYRVTVGEHTFELSARLFYRSALLKTAAETLVQHDGKEYRLFDGAQRRRASTGSAGDLCAPTPGKVLRVLVQPGDQVEAGTLLLILESMKMELQITAPHAGTVKSVHYREGEQVDAGAQLLELASRPSESQMPG